MSPMSAEATVVRNYLDWMLSIPWKKRSKARNDVAIAKEVLDADHYGLDKVKERILEYLAVQGRSNKIRGPILCLVGSHPASARPRWASPSPAPPAATSCACHWGGVRDEAEVRGHRRTYIGSMPGKVIQGMKKAKTSNPLVPAGRDRQARRRLAGRSVLGTAGGADPEQNATFNDHYLEVDYDLSDVMFVTTANSLRMPQPLMDRWRSSASPATRG